MDPLPHIGPLSTRHQKINRWHDSLRMHLACLSTILGLMTLAFVLGDFVLFGVPSRWWASGFAASTMIPNTVLWLLLSRFPKVETVNMRGLTLMNKWLGEHDEWVDPVARWLDACGELDTRHFQCLCERMEGKRRPPGPIDGQWMIRELANGTLCRDPHDLLGGKMRARVAFVAKEARYCHIDSKTSPARSSSLPRRL